LDQYARILNVSPHATDEEIHRAYRKLASTHHPDLGGDKEEFQKILNAYEQLLSPAGKDARENRHYGAAAVARQRNDELRKEKQKRRSAAAAAAADSQPPKNASSNEEVDRRNVPTTEQLLYAEAERQRRYEQSFMTRKLPLQNATTFFILINSLDIFMTYVLISLGAIEANPIAKAGVCVIAQIIAASSISKGRDLLNLGSFLVGAVVAYSCWLLLDKFL